MESPSDPGNPTQATERHILTYTCVAHAFTHLYMVMHTALLEPMRLEFGLSLKELTGYITVSATLFGLGALPAGWLSDHFGQKPLLVVFFFLTSLGGAIIGLAEEPLQLVTGMACMGLGASIFHPVGNALIARGFRSPGRAMGTNGLWGSIGVAVGPIFAPLIAVTISWRWAYLGLLPPMIVAGVLLMRTPLHLPERPPPSRSGNARSIPAALILLFVAMAIGGIYFWLVKTMLPEHIRLRTEGSALSQGLGSLPPILKAGALTGLIYAIGGVGQYLVGRLIRRGKEFKLYATIFLIATPLIYATGQLAGTPLVLTGCLMSVFLFGPQPVENATLARVSPERWKGLVYGLKFVLTFGIGGLGTYVSGWVAQDRGTGAVFSLAAGFTSAAFVVALMAFFADRSHKPTDGGA